MIFFQTMTDKIIEYVGYISDEEARILENRQPSLLDEEQIVRIRRILERL